jgi:hypothetical protein
LQAASQSVNHWQQPTPLPADEQPELTDHDEAPDTDEARHAWQAIPTADVIPAQLITVATQEALRSHALSLGTSYQPSVTTNTHDGSSFVSFAGFSDNTFPDSSTNLEPLGAPSGGSTFSSLPGPSFFSIMGDSGQSLMNANQLPISPEVGTASQLSHVSSSSNTVATSPDSTPADSMNPVQQSTMPVNRPAYDLHPRPEGGSPNRTSPLAPMGCTLTYMVPSSSNQARVTPPPHGSNLASIFTGSDSNMSGRSHASTVPSPSMLTVAQKIKRHEAAASGQAFPKTLSSAAAATKASMAGDVRGRAPASRMERCASKSPGPKNGMLCAHLSDV